LFWLLFSLILNLSLLLFFKYTYFLYDNFRFAAAGLGFQATSLQDLGIRIILPLGISFYTFQSISYTIDTYRKVIKPIDSFSAFFTYVVFWPQLIAGPILRADEVIPQLQDKRRFSWEDTNYGIGRLLIGLLKKVVLADNLAPLVDRAFSMDPTLLSAWDVWLAAILFGFQIYFDFSAYSDMALGSARLLGLRFRENFTWPYLAVSPKAFWNRWHISLSSWIRDYLYLPLARVKVHHRVEGGIGIAGDTAVKKRTLALFLTWGLMGFWHGAGWNFAVWGLYHASGIYLYRRLTTLQNITLRFPAAGWIITFLFVMGGWIPFRAQTFSQLINMVGCVLNPFKYFSALLLVREDYVVAVLLLLGMLVCAALRYFYQRLTWLRKLALPFYGLGVVCATFLILVYLRPVRQFIYFQF